MHHKTLNYYQWLFILLIVLYNNPLYAKETSHKLSTLHLPLHLNLEILEKYLDQSIPMLLTEVNEPNKICIKPQYLKTKGIPECDIKGFKIECEDCWLKIKTIPEIRCDINGWVKRDGPIGIRGEGKNLQLTFPVKAKISTEKPIAATAEAAAILTVDITPHIHKDWSLTIDAKPSFSWSKKPTAKLFKLIEIDIQNRVEGKLKQKIDTFVKTIPNLLAKLRLKDEMRKIWKDLQSPVKIDKHSELYLFYKPQSIAYSGFTVKNNILTTMLSTQGKTEIHLGKPSKPIVKTELPDLRSISEQKGKFYFNIPISIPYQSLLAFSNEKYLTDHSRVMMQNALPGMIKVSNPKIVKADNDKLAISAHINYDNRSNWLKRIDLFHWFDINGEITFTGTPHIDKSKRTLIFDNLDYNSTTNSTLFDTLVDVTTLDPLKSYFSDLLQYRFGAKIDKQLQKANESMKEISKKHFKISANLDTVEIEGIDIAKDLMTVYTELSGIVSVDIDL